jgi:hypothetical protein
VNVRKLEICGHFCFVVRKPLNWNPAMVLREPTWGGVRADGRRVVADTAHLAARALDRASRSVRLSPRVRRSLRRIPGARRLVRAVRRRIAAAGR